jgi:hypothetical protein
MKRLTVAAAVMMVMLFSGSPVQKAMAQQSAGSAPAANPADVASTDAILQAAYDVISGPAGKARNWDRFRAMLIPEARFIVAVPDSKGTITAQVYDTDSFIKGFDSYVGSHGFFEKGIAQRTEQFANIAHVFSTYESRNNATDAKPFARGINSFQLMNDGKRWYIVTIYWQEESDKNPIPKKYLKGE